MSQGTHDDLDYLGSDEENLKEKLFCFIFYWMTKHLLKYGLNFIIPL